LLGGDLIQGYRDSFDDQDQEHTLFKKLLSDNLVEVATLASPGNHDYCTDYQKQVYLSHWGKGDKTYFNHDLVLGETKLRFIILDSVDGWFNEADVSLKAQCNVKKGPNFEPNVADSEISGEQLIFLKNALGDESFNYYFLILGHYPFLDENKDSYWFKEIHPLLARGKTFVFAGDFPLPRKYFGVDGIGYYASGLYWDYEPVKMVDFVLGEIKDGHVAISAKTVRY